MEDGQLATSGVERRGVGEADTRHEVPVATGLARQRERCARRDDVEPSQRIECLPQPEQIVLVGAASVVENEQSDGLAVGCPLAKTERRHGPHPRRCMTVRRHRAGPSGVVGSPPDESASTS